MKHRLQFIVLLFAVSTFAHAPEPKLFFPGSSLFPHDAARDLDFLMSLAVINDGTNMDAVASATGNVFVAQSPEMFSYDADGNVTNDGRWTFTWDAENRLVSMVSLTNNPTESKRRLSFGYDYQGRRITKAVESWTGSSWTMTASNKFVYDGWNLLAELNATNNAVIRSYVWGLDLSGTMQGAGGVGGFLAVYDSSTINAQPSTHFVAHDGNGNVAALVKASDGTTSANYEYGPFGETLRATGLMASVNPFRFSTKYQDDESDLIYYGYRYYSASTGRWLGRDPLEEQGGLNVYGFAWNNAVNSADSDGRILFKPLAMAQRYLAGRLSAFADSTSSAFAGGAADLLASLYRMSAEIMDPSWSDYVDRTVRRYDNAGKIYDRELGPCGNGKFWAGWSAGAYFLGDLFGLNGLPEGRYSVDLATGASLDGWDAWSRGLSGAGSTILFAAPTVSQFKFANQPITFGRTATQLEFDFVNGDLSGRLTQWSVGASGEGLFVSGVNQAGGRVWGSTARITQEDFASIVAQSEGRVTVLTGTHGTQAGALHAERVFFQDDLAAWASQTANVKLIDVTKLSSRQLNLVLGREGNVICAWCWNANNPAVKAAVGGGF